LSRELKSVQDTSASRFTDNFIRLLGMHALSQNTAAQLLEVSAATMSSWMNGKSTPSLAKAIAIGELFGIPTDRLMGATFADLLENELSSGERFEAVQSRINRAKTTLKLT
jgi:DNA-binding XRE family transcriptional regulator